MNVADSASLHLTTGMTLEAWVKPTALSSWNTVIFKERTGFYAEALYANTGSNRPSANAYTSVDNDVRGTAPGRRSTPGRTSPPPTTAVCSRSTSTASRPRLLVVSGPIVTNTGALRIGGNTIWGEYFNGLIDEVRIYNRALSAAEIQTDMNRSVTTPDTTPPSAPGTLTATGGLGQVSLAWGAATDNVGVARYNVYRGTTRRLHPERRRTGSRSRPAPATSTPVSPPAPTTTRSPPRTRPATSGRPATRRPRPRGRHDAADGLDHGARARARRSREP